MKEGVTMHASENNTIHQISRRSFILGGLGILAATPALAEQMSPEDEISLAMEDEDFGIDTLNEVVEPTEPKPEPEPETEPVDDFTATSYKIHFFAPTCEYNSQDAIIIELIAADNSRRFVLIDGGFGPTSGTAQSGYVNRYTASHHSQLQDITNSYWNLKAYIDSLGVAPGNVEFYLGTHAHPDHMGCSAELIEAYKPKIVYTPEYNDKYILPSTDKYYNYQNQIVSGKNLWDNQWNYDRTIAMCDKLGIPVVTSIANWTEAVITVAGLNMTLVNWDTNYRTRTGNNRFNDPNEFSWGIVIDGLGKRVFLGADIENSAGQETALSKWMGKVDLFKLHHHGLNTSNTATLLNAIKPTIAVCTGTNSWPDYNLLSKLASLGTRLFSTDDAFRRGLKGIIATVTQTGITTNFDSLTQGRITQCGNLIYTDGKWNSKTGWISCEGKWYYSEKGLYTRGWKKVSNTYYYFNDTGDIHVGWVKYNGYYYYMKSNGYWARSEILNINGKIYGFNANGNVLHGWNKVNGKYYYFDINNGEARANGQFIIDGSTDIFDANGVLTNGWAKDSKGRWSYMKSNGQWARNEWIKSWNGQWYHFDNNYVMQTNAWVSYGGKWYYMQSNGTMAYSKTLTISGKKYTFAADGHLL